MRKNFLVAHDRMRATTFLIISSLHTTLVTPVLLLMDRKWRASPSVCARFSPFSLPLSNERYQFTFLTLQNVVQNVARGEVTTRIHACASLLRRDRFMNHLLLLDRSLLLLLLPSSPPPPSLSLLVSFLFLSRNPSRTYRFTRARCTFPSEIQPYLFSAIKAIPRCGTHNALIWKKGK